MLRTKPRKLYPNISQLAGELGYTSQRVFSKILKDFWSKRFPGPQFAVISDEELGRTVDDFLEQEGRKIWSQKGHNPFYDDDRHDKIRPKLIAALRRQRQNQFDGRIKQEKKLSGGNDNDGKFQKSPRRVRSSEIKSLKSSLESPCHLETPVTAAQKVKAWGRRPHGQTSARSQERLVLVSSPPLSSDCPAAPPLSGSGLHDVVEERNLRGYSMPARKPREDTATSSRPSVDRSRATSQPTAGSKGAGLARPIRLRLEDGNPLAPSLPRQPPTELQGQTGPGSGASVPDDGHTTDVVDDDAQPFASQDGRMQLPYCASADPPGSDVKTASTQTALLRRSALMEIHTTKPSLVCEHETVHPGLAMGLPDRVATFELQAEQMSYLIGDEVYWIRADQAPRLFQGVLRYLHDYKHGCIEEMGKASDPEVQRKAQLAFLTVREVLHGVKEVGLRARARLEF